MAEQVVTPPDEGVIQIEISEQGNELMYFLVVGMISCEVVNVLCPGLLVTNYGNILRCRNFLNVFICVTNYVVGSFLISACIGADFVCPLQCHIIF